MSIDALEAAKAYANAAKGGGGIATSEPAGPSFAELVKDTVGGLQDDLAKGEAMAQASVQNQADLVDVVTAVTAAEMTVETVVAVRDKVVSAYQQIMRMPI